LPGPAAHQPSLAHCKNATFAKSLIAERKNWNEIISSRRSSPPIIVHYHSPQFTSKDAVQRQTILSSLSKPQKKSLGIL
jgi:hypothetical protein